MGRLLWLTLEIINEYGHSSGEFAPRTKRVLSAGYTLNTDAVDVLTAGGFLRSDTDGVLDGDITITGSLTALEGFVNPENVWILGTTYDSWTIDMSQDSPDRIALIYGDVNREQLYYSLLSDNFHLTDGLSISGGLTISGMGHLDGGIDVNSSRFTTSSLGATYIASTLTVDGVTTLNGDVDLGDLPTDTISLLGKVDTDMTFTGAPTLFAEGGDMRLLPVGDIRLGIGGDSAIASHDIIINGNHVK